MTYERPGTGKKKEQSSEPVAPAEPKAPEVKEIATEVADRAFESELELDERSTDFNDMVDADSGAEQAAEVEPVEPVSDEEIQTAEEAMAKVKFDPDKYVEEIGRGFNSFADYMLAQLQLNEEDTKEFNELAQQFVGKLYGEFRTTMGQISALYEKGKGDEAIQMGLAFVEQAKDEAREHFAGKADEWVKEHDGIVAEAEKQDDPKKKNKMLRAALGAVDLIPFIGDLKIISEGTVGKTMQGKKLAGFRRFAHTAEGMSYLALNVATLGVGGSVIKGGVKGIKVLARSVSGLRKLGLDNQIHRPSYRDGRFSGKLVDEKVVIDNTLDRSFDYARYRRKIKVTA